MLRILVRLERHDPLRIAVRRHDDVGMPDRVVASLDPASPFAIVADGSLAPEAHQIDLGVPLPVPLADRALGIERSIPRLQRDDVERVGAVRAVALDDVAGVGDRSSPWRRTNDRIVDAVAGSPQSAAGTTSLLTIVDLTDPLSCP